MQKAIRYSEHLIQCHALIEAQAVLELCIMYHCDISKCYLLLIDVYRMQDNTTALAKLEETIKNEMASSPFLHKVLAYINPTLKASI